MAGGSRSTLCPDSGTARGGSATGGNGLGLERTASRRRHSHSRRGHPAARCAAYRCRIHPEAGSRATELQAVTSRASFADDGLPVATAITLNAGAVEVAADIQSPAPLRLEAPDGRVAWFARAWATVTTPDGRDGVGWIEWNRNFR